MSWSAPYVFPPTEESSSYCPIATPPSTNVASSDKESALAKRQIMINLARRSADPCAYTPAYYGCRPPTKAPVLKIAAVSGGHDVININGVTYRKVEDLTTETSPVGLPSPSPEPIVDPETGKTVELDETAIDYNSKPVKILVGGRDGRTFYVHGNKLDLKFSEGLFETSSEGVTSVLLRSLDPVYFKNFLDYIYCLPLLTYSNKAYVNAYVLAVQFNKPEVGGMILQDWQASVMYSDHVDASTLWEFLRDAELLYQDANMTEQTREFFRLSVANLIKCSQSDNLCGDFVDCDHELAGPLGAYCRKGGLLGEDLIDVLIQKSTGVKAFTTTADTNSGVDEGLTNNDWGTNKGLTDDGWGVDKGRVADSGEVDRGVASEGCVAGWNNLYVSTFQDDTLSSEAENTGWDTDEENKTPSTTVTQAANDWPHESIKILPNHSSNAGITATALHDSDKGFRTLKFRKGDIITDVRRVVTDGPLHCHKIFYGVIGDTFGFFAADKVAINMPTADPYFQDIYDLRALETTLTTTAVSEKRENDWGGW